ncbi:MAG: hypothetical protein AB1696_23205 [Planctomycetota bacterium]
MNIELDCGVASRYFITDYARSLAVVEAPCALVLARRLDLDGLVVAFSELAAQGPVRPGSRRSSRGREEQEVDKTVMQWRDRLRADFDEILDARPGFSFGYPHPIVVLAESISEDALVVMVVIKLRGITQILGVDLSTSGARLEQLFLPHGMLSRAPREFRRDSKSHRIYPIDDGLSVVAGLGRTVLSPNMNPEEIVKNYPDLPMPPPEEPITYPSLPGASAK